eukprot:gene14621-22361_t
MDKDVCTLAAVHPALAGTPAAKEHVSLLRERVQLLEDWRAGHRRAKADPRVGLVAAREHLLRTQAAIDRLQKKQAEQESSPPRALQDADVAEKRTAPTRPAGLESQLATLQRTREYLLHRSHQLQLDVKRLAEGVAPVVLTPRSKKNAKLARLYCRLPASSPGAAADRSAAPGGASPPPPPRKVAAPSERLVKARPDFVAEALRGDAGGGKAGKKFGTPAAESEATDRLYGDCLARRKRHEQALSSISRALGPVNRLSLRETHDDINDRAVAERLFYAATGKVQLVMERLARSVTPELPTRRHDAVSMAAVNRRLHYATKDTAKERHAALTRRYIDDVLPTFPKLSEKAKTSTVRRLFVAK